MTVALYRTAGAFARHRVVARPRASARSDRQSPDSYLKETFSRTRNSAVLPSSIVTS